MHGTDEGQGSNAGDGTARGGAVGRRGLLGAALAALGMVLPGGVGAKPGRGEDRKGDPGERGRGRGRGGGWHGGEPPKAGCIVKMRDMQLRFENKTANRPYEMTVCEADESTREQPCRWVHRVVRPGDTATFKGWFPTMSLQVTTPDPELRFRAVNPCIGWPKVEVLRMFPSPQEKLLSREFAEGEKATVAGFEVERLPDDEYYKIFAIRALAT